MEDEEETATGHLRWWQEVSSSRSGSPALFPALWSTPLPVKHGLFPSRLQ